MQNILTQKLQDLDAYPKINEDFYNRTLSGGVVSAMIMLFLFFSELSSYLHAVKEITLLVDTSRGEFFKAITPYIHAVKEITLLVDTSRRGIPQAISTFLCLRILDVT